MKNFSEDEIKEFLGDDRNKENKRSIIIIAAVISALVLTAVILAVVISLSGSEQDAPPATGTITGTPSDEDVKYDVSPSEDFEYSITDGYVTINKYIGDKENIVIPDTIENLKVKQIGDEAFQGKNIVSVTISDSVESIGNSAFRDCGTLKKVTLSDSVEKIGDLCFRSCKSLQMITLSENLTHIGVEAFADCSSVTVIDIPKKVSDIGISAFEGCTALKRINIPSSADNVSAYKLFYGCENLETVYLEDGFKGFSYINDTIHHTFASCRDLKVINLPYSFNDENFSLAIANYSVNLSVSPDNPYIKVQDGEILSADGTILYYASIMKLQFHLSDRGYIIDSKIKKVSANAFANLGSQYPIFSHKDCDTSEINSHTEVCTDGFLESVFEYDKNSNIIFDENVLDALEKYVSENDPNFVRGSEIFINPIDLDRVTPEGAIITDMFASDGRNYDRIADIGIVSPYSEPPENHVFVSSDEFVTENGISFRLTIEIIDHERFLYESHGIVKYFLKSENAEEIFDIYMNAAKKALGIDEAPLAPEAFQNQSKLLTVESENYAYGLYASTKDLFFTNDRYTFEIYPDGYYGDDGAGVYTTKNGALTYSVRIINKSTGEIIY